MNLVRPIFCGDVSREFFFDNMMLICLSTCFALMTLWTSVNQQSGFLKCRSRPDQADQFSVRIQVSSVSSGRVTYLGLGENSHWDKKSQRVICSCRMSPSLALAVTFGPEISNV